MDLLWKPRRRAFSCSSSRRQSSMSLKALLSSSRLSSHATESNYDINESGEENSNSNNDTDSRNRTDEEGANLLSEVKEKHPPDPNRKGTSNIQNKIHLPKKRNKCDISDSGSVISVTEFDKRHQSSSRNYVHLENSKTHRRKFDNEDGHGSREQIDHRFRNNSFEFIEDKPKRTIYRPRDDERQSSWRKQSSIEEEKYERRRDGLEKPSDTESEENTIETQSNFSDTVIKISDEDMDFDYDELPRHTGPINKNLRDLYCSNYIHHKLQLLKVEEGKLSGDMTNRSYGIFHRDKFDDIDEGEIAGGVLI